VTIPEGEAVSGVVLADQIRCVSWMERRTEIRGAVAPGVLDEAREKIAALIGIE
jgi:mRNA-degrading endonuclease toxin of MazEF toxin-antitoxin module